MESVNRTRLAPQHSERWSEVLSCTHEMLDAARSEAWERVAELEAQRWDALEVVFEPTEGDGEAREVAACISELLSLDGMILERLTRARDEAARTLGALRSGRRGASAYGGGPA